MTRSLVIPVHNEAGNLLPLVETAVGVLEGLGGDYEIVLVDDGSTDDTAMEIMDILSRWPSCRAMSHPRNLGQSAALLTGLREARGELIMTMDGDGQNDARDFPILVPLVESGELDVGCGWRVNRRDSAVRRIMSRIANAVRSRILGDGLHDAGCQLRVLRAEVVNCLFPVPLLQAFLPAIARAHGFRIGERPVRHHPRRYGSAHYGLRELWWKPAVTMVSLWWRLRVRHRCHPDPERSEGEGGEAGVMPPSRYSG